MPAARKKVVIRQFDAGPSWGYLPPAGFVEGDAVVLLLPDGRTKPLQLNTIKLIAYVRDFNLDDANDPERLGRKTFLGRPRGEGLWLRIGFPDDDQLEGLTSFDLGFLDMLLEDRGLLLSPPDGRGNTQKIFVPRSAIRSLELLGAISSPSKRVSAERAKELVEELQAGLFEG
ncbi:hypothetical protein SAMN05421819_0747 [Bryocella elongata]|uniref:Uncharacterized protein n=1 Tax=Bryocella elongata TaxID=863522 RepID=A0A1H5TUM9_9BACT|nr:hypothetical protein [Bryocella elongata]SEF66535.1 hypothetical protein SAMN05421819_0747 [Bryocella elongata]